MVTSKQTKASESPAAPGSARKEQLGFEPQPMVGWFDPLRLFKVAVQVVLSSIFGKYANKRENQAAQNRLSQTSKFQKEPI